MRVVRASLILVWPFLAVFALTSVIVAGVIAAMVTLEQRDEFVEQSRQVKELVEAERAEEAERDVVEARRREESAERLAAALAEVERINQEQYAELIVRIEELLARPDGVPGDPVTAKPLPGETAPSTAAPAPQPVPASSSDASSGGTAGASVSPAPAPTTTTAPPAPGCAKQDKAKKC